MKENNKVIHPYIPNSVSSIREQMLLEIGAKTIEELYEDIPERLRTKGRMSLPDPFISEYALKMHVESILKKNSTCLEYLSFLGAGCYQHYVPAICDEVNQRGEFLTAYDGGVYTDHGKHQAFFEYLSMMAELLCMDVVSLPTYDGYQATATALRMASRITGRNEIIIPKSVSKELVLKLGDYCKPAISIKFIEFDLKTGQFNIDKLRQVVNSNTAAVYYENPSYLGFIETQGEEISEIVHKQGALNVVRVDPSSLGVITPPAEYGADIVCGDIQSLGIHMNYGGGMAGFIATHEDEKFIAEYPSRLFGIAPTSVEGEYGFGDVSFERTHFAVREEGKEWTGTGAALWGITAGVYLALMGPQGMVDLGKGIMSNSYYAMKKINQVKGIKTPIFQAPHFSEFVVNFNDTGMAVDEVNDALLEHKVFGGINLTDDFPEFGHSALYCVTEIHTKEDIDRLVTALKEVTN
ncbi:MAG: aminomethyl-transferring glycine dehydrogenase subunit GcvPA [Anaerolineales bacterium]